jgi:hypothetical protein
MDQTKQFPASNETQSAPPPAATNKRQNYEPSETVKQFGTRMVQGLNNFTAPLPSTNARPRLRRSEAVEQYIARMVAGLNNFKAEK